MYTTWPRGEPLSLINHRGADGDLPRPATARRGPGCWLHMRFPRLWLALGVYAAVSWALTSTWAGLAAALLLVLPSAVLLLCFSLWLAAPALFFRRAYSRWPWSPPKPPCGMAAHAEGVKLVVDQVLEWRSSPEAERKTLCTAKERRHSVTTRAAEYKAECHRIALFHLNRVVSLDTDSMLITVEPNCDMRAPLLLTEHDSIVSARLLRWAHARCKLAQVCCSTFWLRTTSRCQSLERRTR